MKSFKQKACMTLMLLFVAGSISAQSADSTQIEQPDESGFFYGGLGIGLDYGGYGAKVEYLLVKQLSFFGGMGYNFAPVGWNVGVSYKFLPNKKVSPKLLAMYGYNAVLETEYDYPSYKDATVSYGLTLGLGIDIRVGKKDALSIELLIPFRSDKFMKEYNWVKQYGRIEQPLLPIALTFGWNFRLN